MTEYTYQAEQTIHCSLAPKYLEIMKLEALKRGICLDRFLSGLLSYIARDNLIEAVVDGDTDLFMPSLQTETILTELQVKILEHFMDIAPKNNRFQISKRALARQCGVTRQGAWAAVQRLQTLGYLVILDAGFRKSEATIQLVSRSHIENQELGAGS